eukprot:13177777-Alexandrium_andersonii.AAC.1
MAPAAPRPPAPGQPQLAPESVAVPSDGFSTCSSTISMGIGAPQAQQQWPSGIVPYTAEQLAEAEQRR